VFKTLWEKIKGLGKKGAAIIAAIAVGGIVVLNVETGPEGEWIIYSGADSVVINDSMKYAYFDSSTVLELDELLKGFRVDSLGDSIFWDGPKVFLDSLQSAYSVLPWYEKVALQGTNYDTNTIAYTVKIGDREGRKEHGNILTWFDPRELGISIETNFSDNHRTVYDVFTTSRDNLDDLKKYVRRDSLGFRKKLDFSMVKTKILDPLWLNSLNDKIPNPIMNADSLGIDGSFFKDGKIFDNVSMEDRNVITKGTFSYGASQTYATLLAGLNDIGTIDSALTFLQGAIYTATATGVLNVAVGGFTITIDSDSPPNGNPNAGHITTLSGVGIVAVRVNSSGTGTIIIRNQYVVSQAGATVGGLFQVTASTFTGKIQVHDNMFDGKNIADHYVFQISDSDPVIEMWNNTVLNCDVRAGSAGGIAYYIANHNASSKYEHNNAHNCVDGIDNTAESATYNNFLFSSNTNDVVNNTGSTGNNCASDNSSIGFATENDMLVSLTILNEVSSVTDTDTDFLQLLETGSIDTAGIAATISDNTTGNRSNERPGFDGFTSIGADELRTPIFRSVGPKSTASIQSGSGNNLEISGDTATFASAVGDSIGIGDVIQYDKDDGGAVDTICFIHERISSTQFIVRNSAGETAATTSASDQDWDIFRAYIQLSNINLGTENTGIAAGLRDFDGASGKDLVGTNSIITYACYNDTIDTVKVTISGWTTNAVNFIKIFTPVTTSEVGTSQRHTGIQGTGYTLIPSGTGIALQIDEDFTVVEGLEIKLENGGDSDEGVRFDADNCLLDACIIWTAQSVSNQDGVYVPNGDFIFNIRNCIIYGWDRAGVHIQIFSAGEFTTTLNLFNNIVFDCGTGGAGRGGVRIQTGKVFLRYE